MVLTVFFMVILACISWEKFTSVTITPIDAQPVSNPEPVIAQISPSVVSMWAVKQKGMETYLNMVGCGLVVDSRGLILTSVTLTNDIESLYIIDSEDRKYSARVIASDKKSRLTLLKADSAGNEPAGIFETARLADFEQVNSGDNIFVLGSIRTPGSWELTAKPGRITDPRQSLVIEKVKYRNLVQTDAVLTAENAGGPLVNLDGEVLGFAFPFIRPEGAAAFSYAVGVDQGKNFLARLPIPQWTQGATDPICDWLGAEMLPVSPVVATDLSVPHGRGGLINHIQNNSPAERAGLKRGDVIMGINNSEITNKTSFDQAALALCQTDNTKVQILREGRVKTLAINWNEPVYDPSVKGSMAEVVLVILIFSVIYYFVYKNVFDRVVLFVIGAIVVAITGHHLGFYEQDQMAFALLSKLDVLLFIAGMQLVTGVLDEAGALEYLAKRITLATGGNSWRVMWFFCLVTYTCSLVVNNLTTIMLMAPMVMSLSKYLDCNPKPFLISLIIASNLGGASTMVGDFPNILIATETGLPFYQFTSYMLPICLLELLVFLLYLRLAKPSIFHAVSPLPLSTADGYPDFEPLDEEYPEFSNHADGTDSSHKTFINKLNYRLDKTIKSKDMLRRGLIILAIVIVGFLISDVMKWSPSVVAMCGGIIALVFGGCEPFGLLQKINIRDILFFSGLFVLVGAAQASGALSYLSDGIVHLSFGNTLILCLLVMWFGAIATCFLNAGPTTALFLPIVLTFKNAAPHSLYWWSLSLGVCAGSSGTLIGATAGSVTSNIVDRFIKDRDVSKSASVRDTSESAGSTDKDGYVLTQLTFKEYSSFGLPIMLIFLFISSIYITVLYRW